MRAALKYGIPLAGGLAAGGYALSQGEDPGSAVLAGLAGGAGAAGGLLASRKLAGKYAPALGEAIQQNIIKPVGQALVNVGEKLPEGSRRMEAAEQAAQGLRSMYQSAGNLSSRGLGKTLAAGLVPASAAAAGLGGVALGAIPGAMGVPGFQQQAVDPESYGSSNSPGARYKAPTMQYV